MGAHFGAPMLFAHFGERTASGEFEPIEVWAAKAVTGKKLPAIVGQLTDDDDVQFAETTTVHDERRQSCEIVVAADAAVSAESTVAIPRYTGERFSVDSIAVTGSMKTVRLSRYVIERIQRRGLTRGE